MNAYVVTAGYVTVEAALPGGGRALRDFPRGAVLPADVPSEQIEHELRLGTIESCASVAVPVAEVAAEVPQVTSDPGAMPEGMSVSSTLTWVGDDKDRAAAALAAETAEGGKNRATLVSRLEAVIAA
jgi:hypothetical protein